MPEKTFPKKMSLGFDPFNCGCEKTAEVFRDDTARTLYLLWRSGHMASDEFPAVVLRIAKRISDLKPSTPAKLRLCFRRSADFTPGDIREFCDVAVPFFTGEKTISYSVERKSTRPKCTNCLPDGTVWRGDKKISCPICDGWGFVK